jgi:hypothetical protein
MPDAQAPVYHLEGPLGLSTARCERECHDSLPQKGVRVRSTGFQPGAFNRHAWRYQCEYSIRSPGSRISSITQPM